MKRYDKTREIKHFMTRDIVCASPKDSVLSVCKIMAKKNISCIVIRGAKKPRGIVTERDILKRIVAISREPKYTRAEAIMSKPIIQISQEADLTQALKIMRAKNVRRLAVTSRPNVLEGLITQTDVINALDEILRGKVQEIRTVYDRSQRLFKDSIKALFQTLDAKDHYTGTHSREVARLSQMLAVELKVSDEIVRTIYLAGLFHDIGKIHISDKVLNKQGPLLKEEYAEIKMHPIISEMILKPVAEFEDMLKIIRHHHEWYNGQGYPDGIKGQAIPLGSRIITVVDSYNAMRTNRPYRAAMPRKKAIGILKEMSGKQFDADMVKAFTRILRRNPSL